MADRFSKFWRVLAIIGRETGCPLTWGNVNSETTRIDVYVGAIMTLEMHWNERTKSWQIGLTVVMKDTTYLNAKISH